MKLFFKLYITRVLFFFNKNQETDSGYSKGINLLCIKFGLLIIFIGIFLIRIFDIKIISSEDYLSDYYNNKVYIIIPALIYAFSFEPIFGKKIIETYQKNKDCLKRNFMSIDILIILTIPLTILGIIFCI